MTNVKKYEGSNILSGDSQRSTGRNAQKMNILAARLVAETIKSTLGPKGMDKMLVDENGGVVVTNDGVTILRELDIDHPSAKMVIEIAKTQEDEVGDGTTTAVILAGEFLRRAEELLDSGIHPTVIAKGYRSGCDKALSVLNSLSKDVGVKDKDLLLSVAHTSMTGKGAEDDKDLLGSLIVEALLEIKKQGGSDLRHSVSIVKRVGESVSSSKLVKGVVLDKEKTHASMPSLIKDAKVLLLESALEVKNSSSDAKFSISSVQEMQSLISSEEESLKNLVNKIKESGANAVFCQKGIDDLAQYFLAKNNIFAVRRVKRSDLIKLSKATGAKIVNDLNDDFVSLLGSAGLVEEVKLGEEFSVVVKDCVNAKVFSLIVYGSTNQVVDETARAVEDALGVVSSVLNNGKLVSGAGSVEAELARELRIFAHSLKGREQLVVLSFADSFDVIPKVLAENAGLDAINVLANLRNAHDSGKNSFGVNVFSGEVTDAWVEGVVEPLKVKVQAVLSACEVAILILRIDDVILSGKKPERGNPAGEDF